MPADQAQVEGVPQGLGDLGDRQVTRGGQLRHPFGYRLDARHHDQDRGLAVLDPGDRYRRLIVLERLGEGGEHNVRVVAQQSTPLLIQLALHLRLLSEAALDRRVDVTLGTFGGALTGRRPGRPPDTAVVLDEAVLH